MTDFLGRILAAKRLEIAALDARSLRRAAADAPVPRDILPCLRPVPARPSPALIAELKRASPSKGILAPGLDLLEAAELYARNGASAVSVLTDAPFFMGSLSTLRALRYDRRSALPLLRKDFILEEVQLYETRVGGADAVLLIAAAVGDDPHLAALHAAALDLGLTPLVEVHDEAELERALRIDGLRLVGINNRDLSTFEVSLATTERLRPLIPAPVIVVSESGIFTAAEVRRLAAAGVDAVLVGEALVTADDLPARVRELSGCDAMPEARVPVPRAAEDGG